VACPGGVFWCLIWRLICPGGGLIGGLPALMPAQRFGIGFAYHSDDIPQKA
jgi:hypothetical protein